MSNSVARDAPTLLHLTSAAHECEELELYSFSYTCCALGRYLSVTHVGPGPNWNCVTFYWAIVNYISSTRRPLSSISQLPSALFRILILICREAMDQVAALLEERGPVLASIAVVFTTVLVATLLFGSNHVSHLPLVGSEYGSTDKRRKAFITNGIDFYKKGYEMFKSKAYRLTALDGTKRHLPRGPCSNMDGTLILPVR